MVDWLVGGGKGVLLMFLYAALFWALDDGWMDGWEGMESGLAEAGDETGCWEKRTEGTCRLLAGWLAGWLADGIQQAAR